MIKSIIFAATLLTSAVQAQSSGGTAGGAATPVHATYAGYAHGFNVINLDATLSVSPTSYTLDIEYQLVGVLGSVLHADGKTKVSGRFEGLKAQPESLFSTGHFRGDPRVTQITWKGGNPKILQLIPPAETERDPVPVAQQANTIDTLSAMAALIHQVSVTGKCEGRDRTFDGRRLSDIGAHTAGEETLEQTSRSAFRGKALRCNFEGKQLAGFKRDADQDELRRPQAGSAWLATLVQGAPPIPVRVDFTTQQLGATTMYLTAVH